MTPPLWKIVRQKKRDSQRKAAEEAGEEKKIKFDKRVCLRCRSPKHLLEDCPLNSGDVGKGNADACASTKKKKKSNPVDVCGICYNCGENTHILKNCHEPRRKDGELPFASCFICEKKGHIASKCPNNSTGIYPRGGGCRFCGSNQHLVKDCTARNTALMNEQNETGQRRKEEAAAAVGGGDDGDEVWLGTSEQTRGEPKIKSKKRKVAEETPRGTKKRK